MQVIRISGKLYPPYYGGLPIHAMELSKGLSRYNIHSHIYTINGANYPSRDQKKNITIQRFHPIIEPMDNPLAPGIFYNLLRNKPDVDLIHVHSHLYLTSFWGYLYSKIRSIPLIVTDHGFFADKDFLTNAFQKVYLSAISRPMLQHASAVICYTPYERSLLLKLGVHENHIVVIPNGTDLSQFQYSTTTPREQNTIFWAGRFSKEKGLSDLFHAIHSLQQEFPEIRVRLAGSGDQQRYLRQMAQDLKIADVISFLGRLTPREIYEEMQKATLFVPPSLTEGFPRTIVESFATGLPVIASALPGYAHLPSTCITRYPRNNISTLCTCIAELLRNPKLRNQIAQNARQYANNWFDWKKIVHHTYQLYKYISEGGETPSSLSLI